MHNVVAFIPARSGSKRIKDKNIKLFAGFPLIYWTLKACQESDFIETIYVSTDSLKYVQAIREFNFSKNIFFHRRDLENCSDDATTEDVLLDFIKKDGYRYQDLILLQCTSPLISAKDIDNAINLYYNKSYDVISLVKINRFIWEMDKKNFCFFYPSNYDLSDRKRTQDENFKSIYFENGAIYISSIEKITNTKQRISGNIQAYIMHEKNFLEIDNIEDFYALEGIKKYELHG